MKVITAVDHPGGVRDHFHFENALLVVEERLVLLLGGEDDAVGGFNADGRGAGSDGCQGILDLDKFPGGAAKRRKTNEGFIG